MQKMRVSVDMQKQEGRVKEGDVRVNDAAFTGRCFEICQ